MKRFICRLLVALPLVACTLAPEAALAGSSIASDTIRINVNASIAERCGVAAIGARTNEGGRIDLPTQVAFNFRLDCNTPFKIGVAAQNGALRMTSAASDIRELDGFGISKQYKVGLSFMTDQDGLVDAGICDSEKLSAADPECVFYGAAPGSGFSPGRHTTAIGREGSLVVRWAGERREARRLAAGPYQETITVVVGPRT